MIRSELVTLLNERQPHLLRCNVELAVNCILEQIAEAIESGRRIEVRGFGSFELRHRPPRKARNPKTGEELILPSKVAIHFKPGKQLKDRVNTARDQYHIQY